MLILLKSIHSFYVLLFLLIYFSIYLFIYLETEFNKCILYIRTLKIISYIKYFKFDFINLLIVLT